jgi:hypothetical protein
MCGGAKLLWTSIDKTLGNGQNDEVMAAEAGSKDKLLTKKTPLLGTSSDENGLASASAGCGLIVHLKIARSGSVSLQGPLVSRIMLQHIMICSQSLPSSPKKIC